MSLNAMRIIREQDIAAVLGRDLPWSKFSGQHILVTGAGGFLGGYITRLLLALYPQGMLTRELRVTALVRNASRARVRLADVLSDGQLEIRQCDLSKLSHIDVHNCSYIIHAASQASPRFYKVDPVGTLLPNAIGTAALLEAFRASTEPKGMLFISSSEVYGELPEELCLDEARYGYLDPAAIRSCYAEGKRFGEALSAAFYHQYGIGTYIVRPFHTYGPGLEEDDGRVFADFAFNVIRGQNLRISSDGSARRAFCYVSDAVAGFFTVLLSGAPATPYNVANAAGELSIKQLATLLVSMYPERHLSIEWGANAKDSLYLPSVQRRVVPDTARLNALGWRAEIGCEEGFRRMIDAY